MVNEIIERNRQLIRRSLEKFAAEKIQVTTDLVVDALNHIERNDDTAIVRSGLKRRGAIGIRKIEGITSSTDSNLGGYETYTKQRVAMMIDSGEYEVLTSGLDNQICSKRAQLFTNPTMYFEYVTGEDGEPVKDADTTLQAHREAGGCLMSLCDADYVAAAVDSGPLFVDWKAGHLQYTTINPANVYWKYHDKIIDNGIERGVDYTDIDDCTAMVIKLAGQPAKIDTNSYLAVMGRSDDYPLGRYVYYTARNWYEIPPLNDKSIVSDWITAGGEIANPLSVYAAQNQGGTEYPLIVIKGGVTRTTASSPTPVSTSLYENSLEFDIAFSRLMKDALSQALGLKAVSNPRGAQLPTCLEGAVALNEDQAIQLLSLPIANVQGALEIITKQAQFISESFGVPSYLIASSVTPESGIALSIRTKPLADDLDRRGKLNAPEIARLFEIEKGLYSVYTGGGKELVPTGITQVWKPGRYLYPESEQEKLTRIGDSVDKKYISYVRGVRDYNALATDDQAKELIDTITEQNTEYPPPGSGAKTVGALTAGLAPRPPRKIGV